MEFRILGPVEVEHADRLVEVRRRRERGLLGVLLLEAGGAIPIARLLDLLWDGAPPDTARAALRAHVSRLRALLGGVEVLHIKGGYAIPAEPEAVDALRFRRLVDQAGGTSAAVDRARLLRAAVALWRGPLLAGAASDRLRQRLEAPWAESRLAALEDAVGAELACGRHRELIGELETLHLEHPYRERFTSLRMLALYRAGRQAEALEAFARQDRLLRQERGLDPSAELCQLQQRILARDPALFTDRELVAAGSPDERAVTVPRQLPPSVRHFTGRCAELDLLLQLADDSQNTSETGGAVVISTITGTAGVGKTAMAVHAAHRMAARFPDGQLYVNLRGFDPGGTPMTSAEAIRRFLDAMGVAAQRMPADADDLTAFYRSRLAGRRMLVVLDNAKDAAQVRALLPGSPGCLVLVTSRDQLPELVGLDGAVPVAIDLFTPEEAQDLLARRLGRERVLAEPDAAGELIDRCARLPLALNIAAAHAVLRPVGQLAELVDGLRDAGRRFDALTAGNGTGDVRAVFSWSYRALAAEPARAFRLLGLHPGTDISLPAAASLLGLDTATARRALDDLTRAHLLTQHAPGRYGFHDLLRAYAAEIAGNHDSAEEQRHALRRECDFYLHTAHGAALLLNPRRTPLLLDPPVPSPAPTALALSRMQAAVAWFEAEHLNLMGAQRVAADYRWHLTVWQLAWTLGTFQLRRGHRRATLAVWQAALDAAAHLPDPGAGIRAHRRLGEIHASLGHPEESIQHLKQALALGEQHDDPAGQAHTHRTLAWTWARQGEVRRGLEHAMLALEHYRRLNKPTWEADTLNTMSWFAVRLGEHDLARTHGHVALRLHRQHDDPAGEADTLNCLGYIEHDAGRHEQAVSDYQQALVLYRRLDNTDYVANILDALGHPHAALGQYDQARNAWEQARELYLRQGRTTNAERVDSYLDGVPGR